MIAFSVRVAMFMMDSLVEMTMIESPCVKVCTLETRSGLCLGCGRTIKEIARWSAMTVEERRLVMTELPSRLAAAAAPQNAAG
jgi:hypothetical protein